MVALSFRPTDQIGSAHPARLPGGSIRQPADAADFKPVRAAAGAQNRDAHDRFIVYTDVQIALKMD
jgi:hypothetical protein